MKRVKSKKKHRKGKGKGASFERHVCKALSMWVSHGKREDLFWRSSMSGGRATVARKKGSVVRQAGDITAVNAQGNAFTDAFYVECKFYKHIDLETFLVNGKGKIATWWARCRIEARSYGREPLLIVLQNRWPVLVINRPASMAHCCQPLATLHRRKCDVTLFTDILKTRYVYVR